MVDNHLKIATYHLTKEEGELFHEALKDAQKDYPLPFGITPFPIFCALPLQQSGENKDNIINKIR